MVKALPKKREKGQPKIDGFLVKKKKRAEDNASKTPKAPRAPRAPIPKNAKIIDADGDGDDVIFIDRKAGSQIDLTGESPEKEKPDPDFDMAKSEGDKVVKPEVDLGATDDEVPDQDATDDDMSVDNDTKAIDLTLVAREAQEQRAHARDAAPRRRGRPSPSAASATGAGREAQGGPSGAEAGVRHLWWCEAAAADAGLQGSTV